MEYSACIEEIAYELLIFVAKSKENENFLHFGEKYLILENIAPIILNLEKFEVRIFLKRKEITERGLRLVAN